MRQRLRAEWRSHRALIALVNRMARISSTTHLCRLIVSGVNRTLGLTYSALWLWDPHQERYTLAAVRPRQLLPADLTIDHTDPLMAMIHQSPAPTRLEDLTTRRLAPHTSYDRDRMRSWMQTLEARLRSYRREPARCSPSWASRSSTRARSSARARAGGSSIATSRPGPAPGSGTPRRRRRPRRAGSRSRVRSRSAGVAARSRRAWSRASRPLPS